MIITTPDTELDEKGLYKALILQDYMDRLTHGVRYKEFVQERQNWNLTREFKQLGMQGFMRRHGL